MHVILALKHYIKTYGSRNLCELGALMHPLCSPIADLNLGCCLNKGCKIISRLLKAPKYW